jgi:hypothetical protein
MADLDRILMTSTGLLERLGIPYALMGGIAVRIYGIPRPTYDIDFTIALDRARLPILFQSARDAGYTVPEEYVGGWIDQIAGMPLIKLRVYLHERGIDIDIFLAESPFQKELLARRREARLNDSTAWFVSPEDLILLKLIAGRPRDIADVDDILFTQGPLDQDYMRSWAHQLGVVASLEKALADMSGG